MALYLDTETTGFSPARGDAIVEIAIVDDNGKTLIDTLVNPGRPIPWQASNVHNITDAMVKNKPTLVQLMPTIDQIVKSQQLVIYNSSFDVPFFPNSLRTAASIECAMKAYASKYGGGKWAKLGLAAERAGHVWSGVAHRALADALACKSVWQWMNGVKKPEQNTSKVIISCKSCSQKLRVPGGKYLGVICPSCKASFQVQT